MFPQPRDQAFMKGGISRAPDANHELFVELNAARVIFQKLRRGTIVRSDVYFRAEWTWRIMRDEIYQYRPAEWFLHSRQAGHRIAVHVGMTSRRSLRSSELIAAGLAVTLFNTSMKRRMAGDR